MSDSTILGITVQGSVTQNSRNRQGHTSPIGHWPIEDQFGDKQRDWADLVDTLRTAYGFSNILNVPNPTPVVPDGEIIVGPVENISPDEGGINVAGGSGFIDLDEWIAWLEANGFTCNATECVRRRSIDI